MWRRLHVGRHYFRTFSAVYKAFRFCKFTRRQSVRAAWSSVLRRYRAGKTKASA